MFSRGICDWHLRFIFLNQNRQDCLVELETAFAVRYQTLKLLDFKWKLNGIVHLNTSFKPTRLVFFCLHVLGILLGIVNLKIKVLSVSGPHWGHSIEDKNTIEVSGDQKLVYWSADIYLACFKYQHWPISFSVWTMCSRRHFYFDRAEDGHIIRFNWWIKEVYKKYCNNNCFYLNSNRKANITLSRLPSPFSKYAFVSFTQIFKCLINNEFHKPCSLSCIHQWEVYICVMHGHVYSAASLETHDKH